MTQTETPQVDQKPERWQIAPPVTIAIDFETYYDSSCTVRELGNIAYFNHPSFDAYLVTAAPAGGGPILVADPKKFDWSIIEDAIVLSHNASFDETLYLVGAEKGWWPKVKYRAWHCTADLCSFLGLPRALGKAVDHLYGHGMDKSIRDNMKGKVFAELPEEQQKEFVQYAKDDAEWCLRLWDEHGHKWPKMERVISDENRAMCRRGLPIDTEQLDTNLSNLRQRLFDAENAIPWNGHQKLLSRKAYNEECRKKGLNPPASLAADNPAAIDFVNKHGEAHPWITAVRDYRRINSLLKKMEAFDRSLQDDSRYYGNVLYFGAHTGRFSGSGGNLNLQNLPRGEMFGAHLRKMIRCEKGKTFIIADLSQIEVRTLCWLAKDWDMLDEIAQTDDIYEAFAIRFGRWKPGDGVLKKEDPGLRHDVKQTVLGAGYQASAGRYAQMVGIPLPQAQTAISTYRKTMKSVVNLWKSMQQDMQIAYEAQQNDPGMTFQFQLPSNRILNYGRLKRMRDQTSGFENSFRYFGKTMGAGGFRDTHLFGGKLVENASQALARDIFCDILLRVLGRGYNVVLHVHDELVVEIEEERAKEALEDIIDIMRTPPTWIDQIPLDAEGKISQVYTK